MRERPRHEMLGVWVNRLTTDELYDVIEEEIRAGVSRCVIGNHNLHSVVLHHRDPEMQRFYRYARYIFIDGMPLVWVGRLLGMPVRREHRMTSVDWLRPLLARAAQQGWRIFFVGSRPEVAQRASEVLREEFPGLQMEAAHGYFDVSPGSDENQAVLDRIRDYRTDLLLVGMGMPRQEHWIARELERLDARVIMNLGAVMDYVAGAVPTPPRWMARLGFEWLGRLAAEPRRLGYRYLVEPWFLLPHLARDLRNHRSRSVLDR
jgi:N-acetylglucosaminyldiphosphoundecaprenol N-acetyl-beta-D-mannosaminyltransferase